MTLLEGVNEKDYSNIRITSDEFVDNVPTFVRSKPNDFYNDISNVHKILYQLNLRKNRPLSCQVYYHLMRDEIYIEDICKLHKEWFPSEFNKDYFKRFVLKEKFFAVGAFLRIKGFEYLIGCVLGELTNESKFRKDIPNVLYHKTCFSHCCRKRLKFGYLHSIGVIDEYRKYGIGSELLRLFIDEMNERNVISVYTNVIIHNKSAQSFFIKNKWKDNGSRMDFYFINDKFYDAKMYYFFLKDEFSLNNGFKQASIKSFDNINTIDDNIVEYDEINKSSNKNCLKVTITSIYNKLNNFFHKKSNI